MSPYTLILAAMLVVSAGWWWLAVRLAPGRGWAWIARLFLGAEAALFILKLADRAFGLDLERALPRSLDAAELIWSFLGLGLTAAAAAAVALAAGGRWWARRRSPPPPAPSPGATTRRQFLGAAAVLLPPLYTFGLTGVGLAQLESFRVRRFTLALPGLPRDLDGATLAQVSDLHAGPFTSDRLLRKVAAAVNDLRADLVVLTGDLINRELSDLTGALDLARSLQGRYGRCQIEGNHDLFEDGPQFEARARASGVPFLRDESLVVEVRGQPVQLLGVRWSNGSADDPREAAIARSVRSVLALRQPDAFPILLAHHPHAFDAAAAAGLPLTLSGHTHGGQIMLNDREGVGPIIFRYWSGRYVRGASQLIVSNGVGNWLPLRVNAPAEIVHLTLRRA
jgi:predicted MPP superfamily phosphohydrolase